ncbi:protein N-methyltransferase NNT1 [Aspergillus lentulus]|uniref:Protein N-terminal and lysine N-methyltransferase EFM7 n=1 Tax=Aspergillus lentulus TaxID=293939 RepID=A0AAN4PDL4_ASPLE|nr:protein N-methyltransferase NNT1 [Aspergillus lentulus]
MANEEDFVGLGDTFKDPEGFYPPEKEPTFAEHQMLTGQTVRVRLVGSHPLYGDLLWNAGRTSASYIEEKASSLVEGKDVLEIGAAAGVPSIVSAVKGARTVVMTDYPDPDLVENMRYNASLSAAIIPSSSSLYVDGYKWGDPVEPLTAYLPEGSNSFDLLIMADVVYSYHEHPNLIKVMQKALKKSKDSVALVVFTPYQPWLLPRNQTFFPLAEQSGFQVTKIFEKVMDKVLFENDPGLIVLSGYPCSGLSYRAQQLASLLEATQDELFKSGTIPASRPRYKIHIVPTHDPSHPRTVYDNARTEKEARGVAYTRAKRALGRDSFVILDGMNYIKGYRYQLWCEAKALGTTSCVVHVGTPVDQCIANNEARIRRRDAQQEKSESRDNEPRESSTTESDPQVEAESTTQTNGPSPTTEDTEEPYPPDLLKNLIFRYEEPSTHSRWDKPLFTVPWSDPEPPIAEIWTALTGIPHPSTSTDAETPVTTLTSALASSALLSDTASINTSATARTPRTAALQRPRIKPHQATVQPTATDSSALYAMEKCTSAIVSAIRSYTLTNPSAEAALAQSPDARGIAIAVPEASAPIFIPAHVASSGTTDELAGAGGILALPRLQRLRRQWIGLNRAYVGVNHASGVKGGLAPDQVGDAFVRFLNAEFAGESGV